MLHSGMLSVGDAAVLDHFAPDSGNLIVGALGSGASRREVSA